MLSRVIQMTILSVFTCVMNVWNQTSLSFVTSSCPSGDWSCQFCSRTTRCQVVEFVPSTSISRQFVSILLTILHLIQVPLSWNGDHPSKDLRLCATALSFCSPIRNISQHIFCVWDRIGQMVRHSIPRRSGTRGSSDSSQWCRWCGRSRQRTGRWTENQRERTKWDVQERHDQRWKILRHAQHWQSWAARAVITCEARTKKMCVCVRAVRCSLHTSRRVHACCFWLSAKSGKQSARSQWKAGLSVEAVCNGFPVAIFTSLTADSTDLGLATHESAILAIDGPRWRTPPRWAWWPAWRWWWWLLAFLILRFRNVLRPVKT